MMTVSQFLETLRRSGLVDLAKLDDALQAIEVDASEEQLDDVQYLSSQLVKRYILTVWHVRQLLKGRYKGFFLRQYKILGHLGTGGMSSVFLAEHTLMQRRVAIKVLPRKRLDKSIYLERFIREAQAIASLDHPNIIRAYDIDHEGDVHYIVMEYFQGDNLQKIVERDKPVPFDRIVNTLRQTADALAHAHEIGIVHRDVKPSNILVNTEGEAKILDLGLALLDERIYEGQITHIQENTILGTADYLAPEQALDSHKVDARADIYALGGVLYFCLTGHPPFPDGSVSQRLLAHQQKDPSSILIDRPDTPESLVSICKKMMAKKPEDRYQTAMDLAHEFENWLIEHGHADPSEFMASALSSFRQTGSSEGASFSKRSVLQLARQGKLLQLLHQLEAREARKSNAEPVGSESDFSILGEEASINLLDSTHGSSVHSRLESSSTNRATGDSRSTTSESIDPILHTLNEIERARRLSRQGHGVGPHQNTPATTRKGAAPSRSRRNSAQAREKHGASVVEVETERHIAWYRLVPVWFWTLFFSGYAAAIFLAGILVALLVLVFGASPSPKDL